MGKRKKRDFLKGAIVDISEHSLMRYLTRAEIMTESEYKELRVLADAGDKDAKHRLKQERRTLERKFRNSYLAKFLDDGAEFRREKGGGTRKLNFVAQKYGKKFVLITAYLQGSREDFWKVYTYDENKGAVESGEILPVELHEKVD